MLTLTDFGAAGDGRTDDTAAIQRALDTLTAGDTLVVPAGRAFAHAGVLTVSVPDVRITGSGTLLATREATSALKIRASGVLLDGGLVVATARTTARWAAYEQMGLLLQNASRVTVRDVTVDGSAAAGIYVGGSDHFTLAGVTVRNTRSDGIHITQGSFDGQVDAATVRNTGDDGIAVVSNRSDGLMTHDITIDSPRFYGNTWGRAFSVVGGRNIVWNDVYARGSDAAAIYVASEGSYATYGVEHVTVNGGTLADSNVDASVDHGAVVVYSGQAGYSVSDVTMTGLTITGTRTSAHRNVSVLVNQGSVSAVTFRNFALVGGPATAFYANAAPGTYSTAGWTLNGTPLADRG